MSPACNPPGCSHWWSSSYNRSTSLGSLSLWSLVSCLHSPFSLSKRCGTNLSWLDNEEAWCPSVGLLWRDWGGPGAGDTSYSWDSSQRTNQRPVYTSHDRSRPIRGGDFPGSHRTRHLTPGTRSLLSRICRRCEVKLLFLYCFTKSFLIELDIFICIWTDKW